MDAKQSEKGVVSIVWRQNSPGKLCRLCLSNEYLAGLADSTRNSLYNFWRACLNRIDGVSVDPSGAADPGRQYQLHVDADGQHSIVQDLTARIARSGAASVPPERHARASPTLLNVGWRGGINAGFSTFFGGFRVPEVHCF